MRTRIVASAAVLALTALAGCDDDDNGNGGTTAEVGGLSKSEFVKQADQLCANLTDGGVLTVDERLIGRVDQLVPPDSEQDTITQLLDQWRDYFDQPSEETAAAADEIARELGLDECVIGS